MTSELIPRRRGGHKIFGDANPATRISDLDVAAMRRDYTAGGWTNQALAIKYGISSSQVHRITRGIHRCTT